MSDCGQFGLSVIAFVGSVFSPYYAWSGRKDPEDHVCINVALYAPGASRWSMTERRKSRLKRDPFNFKVGPSSLHWTNGKLVIEFDEVSPPYPPFQWLPKRIKGTITVTPKAVTSRVFDIDTNGKQRWWPIAPSGKVDVRIQKGGIPDWTGHSYLDSNWGTEPLEATFHHWDWARGSAAGDGAMIFYDTQRRDGTRGMICVAIDRDGNVEDVPTPPRQNVKGGAWGVQRNAHCDEDFMPFVATSYEDGPFYLRAKVHTQISGKPLDLMHESFSGDRFATWWVKMMLPFRMPRRSWFGLFYLPVLMGTPSVLGVLAYFWLLF
ncbi:MAG: carotenoid 1,2-hydratase [Pseudomonadota bacterium]